MVNLSSELFTYLTKKSKLTRDVFKTKRKILHVSRSLSKNIIRSYSSIDVFSCIGETNGYLTDAITCVSAKNPTIISFASLNRWQLLPFFRTLLLIILDTC